MQITKMTLTQILDYFQAKIFNKYWGGVKEKFDIYIVVFEDDGWVVSALCSWWLTFYG